MPTQKHPLKVFLCHASENKPVVKDLYDDLVAVGYDPWLDTQVLLPGMDWDLEIKKGLRDSDAVIVCLSSISVAKEGYIQKELRLAQDIQDEKPRGTIFLIPLRLDECETPFDLQDIQWGDYTTSDGIDKLIQALNRRAEQLGKKLGKTTKTPLNIADKIPPVGDLPLGSYLPFVPNPLFTGRLVDLRKLAKVLLNPSARGTVINQAITGMGGVGKTQLAIEFAYRYGSYFKGVHWLNLADPTVLDFEIVQCGRRMGFANWPSKQSDQANRTEFEWKRNGPRLLIMDNFEDSDQSHVVLSRFRHSNLRLLVTSRRSDWPYATGLLSLQLDLFTLKESLAFLSQSIKKRKDRRDDLVALARRLDNLPLALELASRYLGDHPRLSIAEYLRQSERALEHPSMRGWRNDLPAATGHDLDLQRTFALSWQSVTDETAQKIFLIAGYVASPNIPVPPEIFEKALGISTQLCDEGLSKLYGLGLLRLTENNHVSIHPLLREYARGLSTADTATSISILRALEQEMLEDDLHELKNQYYYGVQTFAETSLFWLRQGHYEKAEAQLDTLKENSSTILNELYGLHNSVQRKYYTVENLRAALKLLVDDTLVLFVGKGQFQKSDRQRVLIRFAKTIPLSPLLRYVIVRITSGALMNAIRHSGFLANPTVIIRISLSQMNHHVHLIVQDNGCGANTIKPGYGIRRMQQLVRSVTRLGHDIKLVINSELGKGTEVKLIIASEAAEV
jgi:hypothetical protein